MNASLTNQPLETDKWITIVSMIFDDQTLVPIKAQSTMNTEVSNSEVKHIKNIDMYRGKKLCDHTDGTRIPCEWVQADSREWLSETNCIF